MRATGTFAVADFNLEPWAHPAGVATALPVSVSTMEKRFTGDIEGRSTTIFTSAYDRDSGIGSYVAMESFEGTLGDKQGTFNFVHSASTKGNDRANEFLSIVEGSGTGGLEGIKGSGSIVVEGGVHRILIDYTLT